MRVEPEIVNQYVSAGTVRLAFHHILDHGAGSLNSSVAAECAGSQSPVGFWRMHQALYERQNELFASPGPDYYADIAGGLGLDADALRACMADPAVAEKVTRMDQERRDLGIRQRPSFDVGDRRITGGLPFAQFQEVLDQALASQ